MARLYVLNATGQNIGANYRLDFTVDDVGRRTDTRNVPYKTIPLPARQQIQFGGDWHQEQLNEIVAQLTTGLDAVHVDMVRTAKDMGPVKLVWSEKPIPMTICQDVVAHNMGVLSKIGAQRRERLALVADAGLAALSENNNPHVQMEVEAHRDDDEGSSGTNLEAGFRVDRSKSATPAARGGRRARAV